MIQLPNADGSIAMAVHERWRTLCRANFGSLRIGRNSKIAMEKGVDLVRIASRARAGSGPSIENQILPPMHY
jgi:hypothetical protein